MMCDYCGDTGTVYVPAGYVADEPPEYLLEPCPFCAPGEEAAEAAWDPGGARNFSGWYPGGPRREGGVA